MARIPVTLSGFCRLSAGALRVATVLSLAITLACASVTPQSEFGFKLSPAEPISTVEQIDAAWFEIANRSTKTYAELAYVMLSIRILGIRIEFNAQGDSITGNLIRVRQSSECVANGALLPIMGALVQDLLGRNVGGAVLGAAEALQAYCPSVPDDNR